MRLIKNLFIWSFLALAVSGCIRKPGTKSAEIKSPLPTPPPLGIKWTLEQYQSSVAKCTDGGDHGWKKEQWKTFCHCTFNVIAKRWAYEEYKAKFSETYSTLVAEKVVRSCLVSGGIAKN